MKTSEESLRQDIADSLDRRRIALTEIMRVIAAVNENILLSHACEMAVPMIYAHWEGFAKEGMQLYIEYLEKICLPQSEASISLLAYTWTSSFQRLSGNLTHGRKVELINKFLGSLSDKLFFHKNQREIDTKSNLMFKVLEELASQLCLDIEPMRSSGKKLDAFVNRRNYIAHGGRERRLSQIEVEEYRELALTLMVSLEKIINAAIDTKTYQRQATSNSTIRELR